MEYIPHPVLGFFSNYCAYESRGKLLKGRYIISKSGCSPEFCESNQPSHVPVCYSRDQCEQQGHKPGVSKLKESNTHRFGALQVILPMLQLFNSAAVVQKQP